MKQHLAAIRVLCDWIVVSQVLRTNPAPAVARAKARGDEEVDAGPLGRGSRTLLEGIDIGILVGLRDRALIGVGVMVYSFARVSAVIGMHCADYFSQGRRGWLRLHEKGGKRHDVPAHHLAEAYLDARRGV